VLGEPLGVAVLVPTGIALASTVGKGFIGQYGFVLTRTRRGLGVRAGLLDVRSQSIPVDRVQGVVVLEPLVWRWFGWCEVKVTVAGVEQRGDDDANLTSTLVPVIAGAAGARLAIDALGGRDPGGVMLRQVPAAARVLDPVGWRVEALGVGPDLFVTRRGVLTRRTDMTPRHKLQSCGLRQGPLQRRLGLATLHAHLPTGPVDPEGRHREPAEAWDLALSLATPHGGDGPALPRVV
jgi:putative membrane protein